jgi:hypothetical protein
VMASARIACGSSVQVMSSPNDSSGPGDASSVQGTPSRERLGSLDVMRGLLVAGMILWCRFQWGLEFKAENGAEHKVDVPIRMHANNMGMPMSRCRSVPALCCWLRLDC